MSQTYKIRINIEEDGLDSVNSNLDDFIKRARDATDVQKGLESSFGSASKTYNSSSSDMVRVAKQAQEAKMRLANEEIKTLDMISERSDVVKPRIRIAPIVIEDNADLVESAEEQMAIDNRIIKSKNKLNELTNDQIKLDAIKSIQEKANSKERINDLSDEIAELEKKNKIELNQARIRAIQANSPNSPERRDFKEFESRLKREEIALASNLKSTENLRKNIRVKGDAEEDRDLTKRLTSQSKMILDFHEANIKESENISDEDLLNKTISFQRYLKNIEAMTLKSSQDTLSDSAKTFSEHNERLIRAVADREAKISDISVEEALKRTRASFNSILKEYDDRLDAQLKLQEDAYLRNELSEEQLQRNIFEIFKKSLQGRNQLFARTLKSNNDFEFASYKAQLERGNKSHATNEKIRERETILRIQRESKAQEDEERKNAGVIKGIRDEASREEAERIKREARAQRDQARRAEKIYNTAIRTLVDFNRIGFLAFGRGVSLVTSGVGTLVVTLGVATLALEQLGDRYQELANRIRPVVLTATDLMTSLQGVFDIASELRVNVDDVTNAFSKFAIVFRRINRSNEEAIEFTRDLTLLFKASGANAVEVASNITQISQALNQGVLRGDEFRAVAERLPRVFDALAEVMMVSTGELQSLANRGLIPAEKAIEGFELAASRLGNAFPMQVATLTEAMVVFGNSVVNVIGTLTDINLFRDILLGTATVLNTIASAARGVEDPISKILPDQRVVIGTNRELRVTSDLLNELGERVEDIRAGRTGFSEDEPSFRVRREQRARAEVRAVLAYLEEEDRLLGITRSREEIIERILKLNTTLTELQQNLLKSELASEKAKREALNLESRRVFLLKENQNELRKELELSFESRNLLDRERRINIIINKLKQDNITLNEDQLNQLRDSLNIIDSISRIETTASRVGRTQLENETRRFAELTKQENLINNSIKVKREDLKIEQDKEQSLANYTTHQEAINRLVVTLSREQIRLFKILETTRLSLQERLKIYGQIETLDNSIRQIAKDVNAETNAINNSKEKQLNISNDINLREKGLNLINRVRIVQGKLLEIQDERRNRATKERITSIQNETKNIELQGAALVKAQQTQRIAALQTQEINKNLVGISSTILSSSLERNKVDRDNINNTLRNRFNLSQEEFNLLERTGILNKAGLQTYAEENKSQQDIVNSIISKLGLSKETLQVEQDFSNVLIDQAERKEELNELDRVKEELLRAVAQQEQEINSIIQDSLEERIRQNEMLTSFANEQLINGKLSLSNHMLVTNELGKQTEELQRQVKQRNLLANTDPFTFEGVSDLFSSALQRYLDGANNIMNINEQLNQSFSTFINSSIMGVADSFVEALVSGENFADGLRGTLSSALKQLAKDLLVLIIRFTLLAAFGGTSQKRPQTEGAALYSAGVDAVNIPTPPVALNPIPISPVGLSGASGAAPVISNRIINVVDPSLVGNYLSSPEGTNSILNTIADNSDVVRRSINA